MPGTIPKPLEPVVREFATVAGHLWQLGWAEASAGTAIGRSIPVRPRDGGYRSSEVTSAEILPALAGRRYLVTATGSRFRDLAGSPEDKICLVEIGADGNRVTWNPMIWTDGDVRPTSELPSHLEIYAALGVLGSPSRAILHTHATHLATLSHLERCRDADELNRLLWSTHPESKIFAPRGVALLEYVLPGSAELGAATARAVRDGADTVLWRFHGCIAHAPDPATAFDRIHVLDKAARMVLMCMASGEPWEGLDAAQLAELFARFGS